MPAKARPKSIDVVRMRVRGASGPPQEVGKDKIVKVP